MLGMSRLNRFRAPQVDSETLKKLVESYGTGFRVLGFEILGLARLVKYLVQYVGCLAREVGCLAPLLG